jgi:tRNA(Arg) A34 adenosine deaminase TadA
MVSHDQHCDSNSAAKAHASDLYREMGDLLLAGLNSEAAREISSRDLLIGQILNYMIVRQQQLNLPLEAPAVLLGPDRELISFAVASRAQFDPTQRATIECLRRAADIKGVFQFDGLNYTLYTIADTASEAQKGFDPAPKIDCAGGIYNYAPSRVVLFPPPAGITLDFMSAATEQYTDQAQQHRQMRVDLINEPISGSLNTTACSHSAAYYDRRLPAIAMPQFLLHWYKKYEFVRFAIDGQTPKLSDPNWAALMLDLHEAAWENTNASGGPFAAAIVSSKGQLISIGVNRVVKGNDATAHGERSAIAMAIELNPEIDLRGCSLVTSSMTCISCAEQSALAKVSAIIYGNHRDVVEKLTPFTEGPLDSNFFARSRIGLYHLACDEELEIMAFNRFSELVSSGGNTSYLHDHTKIT